MSVYDKSSEACQICLHCSPMKTFQTLREYLHHLFVLTSVSCSVWTCSRLATAMPGITKHASTPSCVANKRSESIPEVQGHKEDFKQLFASKVFWQSLKNKNFFPLPFNPPHFLAVNSGEHLIRKNSSSRNPVLCKAVCWYFLQGCELCKLCKLEQIIRITSNYSLENFFPVFLIHLKNKEQTQERKSKCLESIALFFIHIWTICRNVENQKLVETVECLLHSSLKIKLRVFFKLHAQKSVIILYKDSMGKKLRNLTKVVAKK